MIGGMVETWIGMVSQLTWLQALILSGCMLHPFLSLHNESDGSNSERFLHPDRVLQLLIGYMHRFIDVDTPLLLAEDPVQGGYNGNSQPGLIF